MDGDGQVTSPRIPTILWIAPAAGLATCYALAPVLLALSTGFQNWEHPKPLGLTQVDLANLIWDSFWIPCLSSLLAIAITLPLNLISFFCVPFRKLWFTVLMLVLFTNPIFFVFVWAFLWPWTKGSVAVICAAGYILTPLAALVTESGLRSVPMTIVNLSRVSGASPANVCRDLLIPWIWPQFVVAWLLGFMSALGFFLVPLYVGGGRVRSATVWIDRSLNQLGDSEMAGYFILIITGLAVLGMLLAGGIHRILDSSTAEQRP